MMKKNELPADSLQCVSGGDVEFMEIEVDAVCPDCGSDNVFYLLAVGDPLEAGCYSCRYCHLTWKGPRPAEGGVSTHSEVIGK